MEPFGVQQVPHDILQDPIPSEINSLVIHNNVVIQVPAEACTIAIRDFDYVPVVKVRIDVAICAKNWSRGRLPRRPGATAAKEGKRTSIAILLIITPAAAVLK